MDKEETNLAQDEMAKNPEPVEAEPKPLDITTDNGEDILLDAGMAGGETGKRSGNLRLAKNGHVS